MLNDTVTAISAADLRSQLPPLPSGFERELANIGSIQGKPMFKVVDGQREMKFRNGKMDVKHLLQSSEFPCYIPVVSFLYARQILATGEYKQYPTHAKAAADTTEGLALNIKGAKSITTRAIGRACWIVEVYITPEEVGEAAWNESRFADLQSKGILRRVDVLGPFPREGMYVYCFSVLGANGEAIAPNEGTLTECRRRWSLIQSETRTAEQDAQFTEDAMEEFEKKQIERIADNFYQIQGISARRLHYGTISKPIITTL